MYMYQLIYVVLSYVGGNKESIYLSYATSVQFYTSLFPPLHYIVTFTQ